MKVLLVPMLAAGQTDGPFSRVRALARSFLNQGCKTAVCIGDENCTPIPDAQTMRLTMPVPMGMPRCIGMITYPLADRLGLMGKKEVRSFEEVLRLTGTLSYGYLKRSIQELRDVIRAFNPDLVYSEFNISAIIAAKAEEVPAVGSYSLPITSDFACSPQFADGCNRILKELGQPSVHSSLELFERMETKFVPSSFALEPIAGDAVQFVGPFGRPNAPLQEKQNRKILVYMGTGVVSTSKLQRTMIRALRGTPYEVYLAGMSQNADVENIHMAHRFPFSDLLPGAAISIHHGGQNSVMDALLCGVPQLVYPGRVFERRFNAKTVEKNGVGIVLNAGQFFAGDILNAVQRLTSDNSFRENSAALGKTLRSLGGSDAVADYLVSKYKPDSNRRDFKARLSQQ